MYYKPFISFLKTTFSLPGCFICYLCGQSRYYGRGPRTSVPILGDYQLCRPDGETVEMYISVRSGYGVASFPGATTTEAINDGGAAVVEAAAGQADAAQAGDDDEQHEEGRYQPDPPDDPTFPVYV